MLQCEWFVDEALWVISGQDSLGKSCRALGFCCVVPLHKAWAFAGNPDWWKSCLKYQTRAHSARIYTVLHMPLFSFSSFSWLCPRYFHWKRLPATAQWHRCLSGRHPAGHASARQRYHHRDGRIHRRQPSDNRCSESIRVSDVSVLSVSMCWLFSRAQCAF